MAESKPTLENLVCNGKTSEAIEQLKSLIETLNKEHLTNLVALSGRYSNNYRATMDGTALTETKNVEDNRIRFQFLSILSDVREEIEDKINFFKPIPRDTETHDTLRDFIHTTLSRKYEEISHFGEGRSFIYFSAKERHADQQVIIMVMKTSNVGDIKKNISLSKISQLKHRNLIQLLDVNFNQYPYYLITELVAGVDLKTMLESMGTIPLYMAKNLLLTVGDVMDYLRQKKFPHSGIRPSKVLIDHEMQPEISPFDIHHVDEKRRLYATFFEDCFYYAPERLFELNKNNKSEQIDKANQFCLAALAYEMLTGKKIFPGKHAGEVILSRNQFFNDAEYRKQRLADPLLPPRMALILKRMLAFDPNKRYPDMSTALREIGRVRVVLDNSEKLLFDSYRRCLSYAENFPEHFYQKLFPDTIEELEKNLEPEEKKKKERIRKIQETLAKYKPDDAKKRMMFFQRFQIAIYMLFDMQNMNGSIEKAAQLLPSKGDTPASRMDYEALFEAFTSTIEEIDPLWNHHEERVRKAWNNMKDLILGILDEYLPPQPPHALPGEDVLVGVSYPASQPASPEQKSVDTEGETTSGIVEKGEEAGEAEGP